MAEIDTFRFFFRPIVFTTNFPNSFKAVLVMATLKDESLQEHCHNNSTLNSSQQRASERISVSNNQTANRKPGNSRQASTQRESQLLLSLPSSPALTPIQQRLAPDPGQADTQPVNSGGVNTKKPSQDDTQPYNGGGDSNPDPGQADTQPVNSGRDNTPNPSQDVTQPYNGCGKNTPNPGQDDSQPFNGDRDGPDDMEVDEIPASPPTKKARIFWKKCYNKTLIPSRVPGADKILAPDSDEDS